MSQTKCPPVSGLLVVLSWRPLSLQPDRLARTLTSVPSCCLCHSEPSEEQEKMLLGRQFWACVCDKQGLGYQWAFLVHRFWASSTPVWWRVPMISLGVLYSLPRYKENGGLSSIENSPERLCLVDPRNCMVGELLSGEASVPFGSWHLAPSHSPLNYILLLRLTVLKILESYIEKQDNRELSRQHVSRARSPEFKSSPSLNNCVDMSERFNLFVTDMFPHLYFGVDRCNVAASPSSGCCEDEMS